MFNSSKSKCVSSKRLSKKKRNAKKKAQRCRKAQPRDRFASRQVGGMGGDTQAAPRGPYHDAIIIYGVVIR